MAERRIVGSFAAGGITGMIVDMLEAGVFRTLFDVQCFDLKAVESYRRNPAHQAMSASMYANPHNRGAVVNQLDTMILGAAEIDLDFNVNVTTGHGRHDHRRLGRAQRHGGRRQTGARDNPARRRALPEGRRAGRDRDDARGDDRCGGHGGGCCGQPAPGGPARPLGRGRPPVVPIEQLREMAERRTGGPFQPTERESGRVVAVVEYRDGTVIDVVRQVEGGGASYLGRHAVRYR